MTGSDEPTQARVLRERSSGVPWRQAIVGAIRERTGGGRTALPDRLEGAVYGQLAARATAGGETAAGAAGGPGERMLRLLDAMLAASEGAPGGVRPDRPGGAAMVVTSPDEVLPIALVLRDRAPREVAGTAASASGSEVEDRVAGALYALVVRRLLSGARGRAAALDGAARDLRSSAGPDGSRPAEDAAAVDAALAALVAPRARPGRSAASPSIERFRAGWEAFERSSSYRGAVSSALGRGPDPAGSAVFAGGLAGACWGGACIPAAWRRATDGPVVRALVDRLIRTDAPGWDGEPWRTSTSDPLVVDFLDLSGLDGCAVGAVGITSLPGRRYVGYHTGAHWRDLDTDAARLRGLGVEVLLLLVEDHELERCRVTGIADALAAHGVALVRFPIRDPLVPRDGAAFRSTLASLVERVRSGASAAIACRGGLDRAGMTAACLLREAGLDADEAIRRVHRARPRALQLPDQQAFVRRWPPRT